LGKISVKSNRAPKQAIEVAPAQSSQEQLVSTTLSSFADLSYAEKIHDAALKVEEMNRKKVPTKEDLLEK
jgi:hypothetical protein